MTNTSQGTKDHHEVVQAQHVDLDPRTRILATFFILSGFAGVAYQVVLSRSVQLIVGATAYAVSALLVAFMLGTSIGSMVGGRLADRVKAPLKLYGAAEIGIGLYALLFPLLISGLESIYLDLIPAIGTAPVARNVVRFVIGVASFILPAFFMGVTTPAFALAITANKPNAGPWLARLYGWNTFGAAFGAFLSAYLLVPNLGIDGATFVLAALNISIGLLAISKNSSLVDAMKGEGTASVDTTKSDPSAAKGSSTSRPPDSWVIMLVVVSFSTGFLSFALEIIWTHLLAILLGNSVYAFGLMLGALLLGLALGTLIARKVMKSELDLKLVLGSVLTLAGAFVGLSLGVWDDIPQIFLWVSKLSPSFMMMELLRLLVAMAMMIVPTMLFGSAFPVVLHLFTEHRRDSFGKGVGFVYTVNTLGAVLGALCGPYVLLDNFGSQLSLRILALGLLTVGILVTAIFTRNRSMSLLQVTIAILVAVLPVDWSLNRLNMAASIYLGDSASKKGNVVFQAEDATGGLVSVVEDRRVRTLLTNGKFQGDSSEEIPIQRRLANIPTLFTSGRKNAFVIGLGTGGTLATLAAHDFDKVVCAELSVPIVDAARKYFSDVNFDVLDSPEVELLLEDGRSVLLERPDRYDVISVEVTTIWFAGVGSIYSQEFYKLASSRLRHKGVLLQWFPIHHLSAMNLYTVINTVRSVFPYVSVWTHRHQGFVIASQQPLELDLASIRSDAQNQRLEPHLSELRTKHPLELLSDVVVTDKDVDGFLDAMAALLRTDRTRVSTDLWPTLEYETPKDLLSNFSYFQNRGIFRRFRSQTIFPFRGEPTEAEKQVAKTSFRLGWNDPQALIEIAKLWSKSGDVASSGWLLDELAGRDPVDTAEQPGPSKVFASGAKYLTEALSTLRSSALCEPVGDAFEPSTILSPKVSNSNGVNLEKSSPDAVLDGLFEHQNNFGAWIVRPYGSTPWVEIDFTPSRLNSVRVAAKSIDGRLLRTRVLLREAGTSKSPGRWRVLDDGAVQELVYCSEIRHYQLQDIPLVFDRIRVEAEGEARSHRLQISEIYLEDARTQPDSSAVVPSVELNDLVGSDND